MTRRLLTLFLLVAAVAFALPASASVVETRLNAVVGPGFTISLTDANGNAVTQLAPGAYEFDVHDNSDIHDFHLTGPGVDVSTRVDETGEVIWNLTLSAGTYSYFCDPHRDTMFGSFTVGSGATPPPPAPPPAPPSPPPSPPPAPPPPPPPPPPAPPPAPAPAPAPPPPPPPSPPPASTAGTLTGTVGPGFTITLTDAAGARVSNLDPGTYTIQVHDLATVHNFHLFGPGVDQSTTVEFVGDATWTVTLAAGTYTYECDPHSEQMKGTFTVGGAVAPPPAPPPPPPASPPPAPRTTKLPKLQGTVGPGYTIKLGGPKVKKAGTYLVTISDRSAIHDFHLVGPSVDKKTGVGFRGTVTWTVKLKKKSTYRYWCDPHKAVMKGSFRTK